MILAYAAYFGNWFTGPGGAQGILLPSEEVVDVEDYDFLKENGDRYTGKELETLYWWIIPIDESRCDQQCANLNLHTINQTYIGLGKEALRINELVILTEASSIDVGKFPKATSLFDNTGVVPKKKTQSGKRLSLPANYIYLVDPLGNIFMKYPLVKDAEDAPLVSKKLRRDILHLFKYSRLG